MSSGHSGDEDDTCDFGHVFEVNGSSPFAEDIESGEISSLEDLSKAQEDADDPYSFIGVMGDPYKNVKVVSGSQGMPYTFILVAADKFDTDLDWDIVKTDEKIFVSPQNTMHQEMNQRRQQAEQNIKTSMQGLEQLRKSKHLLQHDIRKLRSRVEDLQTGDDVVIKGDFVQLVDGAGAGGQGADEQALRFLRDNNIYPTIVSDFNEMESLEDLEEGGKLSNLPANEKAILKKKYTMFEKWKDMYGSEIQRKLNDLKKELRRIERAIEETKEWLEPYARDMVMINQKTRDEIGNDINEYGSFVGYATMYKELEFIAHQGLVKEEGALVESDNEKEITHYKVVHIHAVHVNISGGENPNSPVEGPTVAVVFWRPAIVCKHVFENIIEKKINRSKELFEQLMDDYTGDFDKGEGKDLKDARNKKEISVRALREKIGEEVEEKPPLELSSTIRRVEDGFDSPKLIAEKYGDGYLEALDNILDTSYSKGDGDSENGGGSKEEDFKKAVRKFTGNYDEYYLGDLSPLSDLKTELKFSYYYDLKLGMGLHTMK